MKTLAQVRAELVKECHADPQRLDALCMRAIKKISENAEWLTREPTDQELANALLAIRNENGRIGRTEMEL